MNTEEKIAVMQAFVDGQKIEVRCCDCPGLPWGVMEKDGDEPFWNWCLFDYRVAKTPDSIEWNAVAPEYKWMARDESGTSYLFASKPYFCGDIWDSNGNASRSDTFVSYKRGTVDWRDSLVERPK